MKLSDLDILCESVISDQDMTTIKSIADAEGVGVEVVIRRAVRLFVDSCVPTHSNLGGNAA